MSKKHHKKQEKKATKAKKKFMKVNGASIGNLDNLTSKREVYPNFFKPYEPPPGVVGTSSTIRANDMMVTDGFFRNFNITDSELTTLFEEGIGFAGYTYLTQLQLREEYRKIIETHAKEATREWITLKAVKSDDDTAQTIRQIEKEMERLEIKELIRQTLVDEGYYGMSHIYIDMQDARLDPTEKETPLFINTNKIVKGSFKRFIRVEPYWTTPASYNSTKPLEDYFFKPELWWINGECVHESRLITLITKPVGDILKPVFNFGGASMAFIAKPYIDNWIRTRQSVSDMVKSYSVLVLKTDLDMILGDSCEELRKRLSIMTALRDNRGIQVVDYTNEELQNVAIPINGLDKLQAQSQEHMSAVSGIPLVKLLGITPSGLNASSDGEVRCYYDNIRAYQEAFIRKPLKKIIDIIQLNLFGEIKENIEFEFNSLWQLDEMQLADVISKLCTSLMTLFNTGAIGADDICRILMSLKWEMFRDVELDPEKALEREESSQFDWSAMKENPNEGAKA